MKHAKLLALGAIASLSLAAGAHAATYTSDPFNGQQPGGSADQPSTVSAFGQYFSSATGGNFSSLSFLDTDSTNTGTNLIIQAFNTASLTASGPVLFNSADFAGSSSVAGYGDATYAASTDGDATIDQFYRHTFDITGVNLAAGQSYIAYLVDAAGTNTFNGTTTYGLTYDDDGNVLTNPPCSGGLGDDCSEDQPVGTISNGAYGFGLGKYDSALGGAGVYRNGNGAFVQTINPTKGESMYFVADYSITIDPAAPAAAVPETASWAMMIGGFGLAGAALRRRRTSVSFA